MPPTDVTREELRRAAEADPHGLAIFRVIRDGTGSVVDFEWAYRNPAAMDMTPQVPRDLIGQRLLDVMPHLRGSDIFARYVRVVETGVPDELEPRTQRDGEDVWHLIRVSAIPGAIAVHYRDVSLRRRAEQASVRLHERLSVLARASELLATSMDWETTLATVAGLALPMLGDFCFFDVVEPTGAVRRIVRTHDDPRRFELLKDTQWVRSERADINLCALSTGKTGVHATIDDAWMQGIAQSEGHLALLRSLAFRSMVTVPLRYQDNLLGALTIFYADSNRHHSADEVTLLEELARRAAAAVQNARLLHDARAAIKTRDGFLSVASHELKTPLTALLLQVAALKRSLDRHAASDDAAARTLERVERQGRRLGALVDELLDVSRVSTGQFQLRREEVEVGALLEEIAARFQPAAQEAGCTLHVVRAGDAVGNWDRNRLEQVFNNLLSNALKYGRGRPVQVRARNDDDHVIVDVMDQGIGIEPEDQRRIFERFERAVGVRELPGMGLGLWIAREIVLAHNGVIDVESAPGIGSTFTVRLPRT